MSTTTKTPATAKSSVTEVKSPPAAVTDTASRKMYEALMHIMHHPSECSSTVWDLAREALEAAGMDYDRDVASVRDSRIREEAARIADANDPYRHVRQRVRISPTEPVEPAEG